MSNTTLRTTAANPSRFALPASALLSMERGTRPSIGRGVTGHVCPQAGISPTVRGRLATGADVRLGFAFAYVPGTSVWRPPS